MDLSFALLITVYNGIHPKWMDACLASVAAQTRLPNEIVLVEDGILAAQLSGVIDRWANRIPLRRVPKEGPSGAGAAAQFGLRHCQSAWVARLDADDLALPDRFALQLAYLRRHPEVDVLSGYLVEFAQSPDRARHIRQVPLAHRAIARRMRLRCAINNSCVIVRRSKLNALGGYEDLATHEDYLLWMKMLHAGCQFANVPKVLIRVRMDQTTLSRRRGLAAMQQEWRFQRILLRRGYLSPGQFIINTFLRLPPRLLPRSLLALVYSLLLRRAIP